MNPGTITGTLSWYKILLLHEFNLIRAKRNPHMRRKKLIKIIGTVARTESRLYRQLDGIWENIVKIYHGITALQHLHRSETMASLKEPFDE